MPAKFAFRTIRNVFFRGHPYFAHLAITHRCNMRCRCCHISEEHFEELSLNEMKRVIDILDRMGIAVLSISGGGEPLLRRDCFAIINYAAAKGMYTKLTSNGTMPLACYRDLLNCRIKEIGVSLDGVQGNDIPFSHVGPRILESIRFLNDHLPRDKKLTLNVTISQSNRDQVHQIVDYCTKEFPNARIWLNPVVVGSGKLRRESEEKVNPDYLRHIESPTLLSAEFFRRGAEEQYRNRVFNWGCLAGRFFFDIKPNGDFWLCQDLPSDTSLNVLDPAFLEKYREADFSSRRECSGCTYSCYFVTQKFFEPSAWPDMAVMWWKTVTKPGDRCRSVAEKHGWVAGLFYLVSARAFAVARQPLALLLLLALLLGSVPLWARQSDVLTPDEVILKMEEYNVARRDGLASFRSVRRYQAGNTGLHRQASMLVEMRFSAPGEKSFRVIERNGSKIIQTHVIEPLLSAERASTQLNTRLGTDICRRNYSFTFIGRDGESGAYMFNARPVKPGKYLFRGRVWVDANDFAIRRIEGEPVISPSFWVRRTHFVHEYARFGDFWFPVSNHTEAELRLFGKSHLKIEYFDYEWSPTTIGKIAESGVDKESGAATRLAARLRP